MKKQAKKVTGKHRKKVAGKKEKKSKISRGFCFINFFAIMALNAGFKREGTIIIMTSFIPGGNGAFDYWQKNLIAKINSFKAGWDLSGTAMAELSVIMGSAKKLRWDAAWAVVSTGEFLHSQEKEMLDARKAYEYGIKEDPADTSLRLFITRYIRNNPKVTNEQKIAMGLIVADTGNKSNASASAKVSGEITPVVKYMKHLVHYLGVKDPDKKTFSKEQGVAEIGIFIAFTEGNVKECPPMSAFQYDGKAFRGSYVRTFSPDQEGLRVWYIARKKGKGRNSTFGSPGFPANSLIA